MTVRVIVDEAKWCAHGAATPEQAERWHLWLARAEPRGRAAPLGSHTIVGGTWSIACDDREDAGQLCMWLQQSCGYTRTMLTIRSAR